MFKNESHILEEWISHYLREGVDHFFLTDNGSTDSYQSILRPFIEAGQVTLRIEPRNFVQEEAYNVFLHACKRFEWVLVCDLDEFIYARKGYATIPDYLNSLPPRITQVFVPWKMFGANGFDTLDRPQPPSVVEAFTKRLGYDRDLFFRCIHREFGKQWIFTKCFARTAYLKSMSIHSQNVKNERLMITSNNRLRDQIHPSKQYAQINENILENSFLHCNHYAIQSFSWFMQVKATRGDGVHPQCVNVRDETYFRDYDNHGGDLEDTELKSKG